jgi:hypothetical protein
MHPSGWGNPLFQLVAGLLRLNGSSLACAVRLFHSSRCGGGSFCVLSALFVHDDDFARHIIMTVAAENIAIEGECSCLFGSDFYFGYLAFGNVGTQVQSRDVETVLAVKARQMQNSRHVFFQSDHWGREFVFLGSDVDYIGFVGATARYTENARQTNCQRQDNRSGFLRLHIGFLVIIGN